MLRVKSIADLVAELPFPHGPAEEDTVCVAEVVEDFLKRRCLAGRQQMKKQHPIQPVVKDNSGVERFKSNKIVSFLLDAGPFDMNQLACIDFSREDREQFAQLIGYSVSGFADLSYVRGSTWKRVQEESEAGQ